MRNEEANQWSIATAGGGCRSELLERREVSLKRPSPVGPVLGAVVFVLMALGLAAAAAVATGPLEELAKPQEGRAMRVTSTMRVGEVRRGGGETKVLPRAEPKGDLVESSNRFISIGFFICATLCVAPPDTDSCKYHTHVSGRKQAA